MSYYVFLCHYNGSYNTPSFTKYNVLKHIACLMHTSADPICNKKRNIP